MDKNSIEKPNRTACKLPRKNEAIEALFGLAWKKQRKDRPQWLLEELSAY